MPSRLQLLEIEHHELWTLHYAWNRFSLQSKLRGTWFHILPEEDLILDNVRSPDCFIFCGENSFSSEEKNLTKKFITKHDGSQKESTLLAGTLRLNSISLLNVYRPHFPAGDILFDWNGSQQPSTRCGGPSSISVYRRLQIEARTLSRSAGVIYVFSLIRKTIQLYDRWRRFRFSRSRL